MSVTVPELKAQLNIDHDLDDLILVQKIEAATAFASSYIGGEIPDPMPAAIRQAILMLAASWYANREAISFGNPQLMPYGFSDLLQAHRCWVV